MAARARSEALVKRVWGIVLSPQKGLSFRYGAGSAVRGFLGTCQEGQGHMLRRLSQLQALASCEDSRSSFGNASRIVPQVTHPCRLFHASGVDCSLQAVETRNLGGKDVVGSEAGPTGEAGYTYRDEKTVGRRGTYNRSDSLSYLHARQRDVVRKLVNICMVDGKKATARGIVYKALTNLSQHGDVVAILDRALENVKPMCEVKKVRKAGITQLVPCIIARNRQETLAMRWLLDAATKQRSAKKSMGLDQCLSAEILDASQKTGGARKKRDELHKVAEANRGSSHFRWW